MLEKLEEYYQFKLDERDKIGDRWKGGEYNFMFYHTDGKAFHQERPARYY